MQLPRRRILTLLSTLAVSGFAGCSSVFQGDSTTDEDYEQLQRRPIYFDDDVSLSVPDTVQVVTEPADADLVVVPDTPDTTAAQAVEWLVAGQAVALVGPAAQSTWLTWVRSDAYDEAFSPEGIAEGSPEPDLLIAWDAGPVVTTQSYSWESGPDDRDILEKLDETLADIGP